MAASIGRSSAPANPWRCALGSYSEQGQEPVPERGQRLVPRVDVTARADQPATHPPAEGGDDAPGHGAQ